MPDFGLMIFPTDYSVEPVVLAREAESFGFESLFFPEHTHIPANRLSPWPGGAELPRHYWHAHDPFVALAAVSSATTSLKLGTGIALVTERDPILMAKQVASLDHLSKGRVLLGVGAGWNAEEMGIMEYLFRIDGESYAKEFWQCEKSGERKRQSSRGSL